MDIEKHMAKILKFALSYTNNVFNMFQYLACSLLRLQILERTFSLFHTATELSSEALQKSSDTAKEF